MFFVTEELLLLASIFDKYDYVRKTVVHWEKNHVVFVFNPPPLPRHAFCKPTFLQRFTMFKIILR